jgi:ABC-type molybdenum transport system ATPase subunit/photorepair protein PhrA
MDLVDRLCRSGRTVVLVTHHDDEVIPSVARELWLRDGRVERAVVRDARRGAPVAGEEAR